MPRRLAVGAAMIAALAVADPVEAETRTQGSTLASPANYSYGCETRWMPGLSTYDPLYVGPSTCTIFWSGTDVSKSTFVPGSGTILTARVKSGPNPAPLQISTIRRYFKPDSSGVMQYTCCFGVSQTATFTPTPNAVTEVPVNLAVSTQQPENGQTGWFDLVAVTAEGPGSLPISDLGPHSAYAGSEVPATYWYFPKIAPSADNQNQWFAPNFEVLMNFTWCSGAATGRATTRAACAPDAPPPVDTTPQPPVDTTPQPPAQTDPKKLVAVGSRSLKLKGSSVNVQVTCTQTTACAATVRLQTRAKKPVVLGTKKATIAAGKSKNVALKLSAKSRKKVTKKGLKVTAVVDLGAAGKVERALTLRK
jgi:hypothetical protein